MGAHKAQAHTASTFAVRLGDLLLTILALAGSLCLVFVILSLTLNISIMMFKTGSMSPTITAGSIALVKEIPASELEVGDIATVQRGHGELPVTHRVTEIKSIARDGTVTFTMKGDGNATPDVEPYSASTVQRVFFSVPELAPLIQKLNSPYVLGMLTLGAAALVVWAFWPHDRGEEEEDEQVKEQGYPQYSVLLPAVLLAATVTFVPQTQNSTIHNVEGEYLRLASISTATMSNMSPGQSATWSIDVWAEAADEGLIDVELRILPSSGESSPWEITVLSCTVSGDALPSACIQPPRELLSDLSASMVAVKPGISVASFSSEERHRFQVVASLSSGLPASKSIPPLEVALLATGLGEEVSASPDPPDSDSPDGPGENDRDLAETGSANLPAFVILASSVTALGASLRLLGRMRRNG